jgi:hypothetical protein
MKKILVFIGLKIGEIGIIIFLPYFIGLLVIRWDWYTEFFFTERPAVWIVGLSFLFYLLFALVFLAMIGLLINTNWKWAKKIANKNKG